MHVIKNWYFSFCPFGQTIWNKVYSVVEFDVMTSMAFRHLTLFFTYQYYLAPFYI